MKTVIEKHSGGDMKKIDLRSDTVTKPSNEMLQAMITAQVGDDVFGEDPTVNELEAYAAELCGKEAAVFAPTGTQSNLIGLMAHCQRGDEYVVGQQAHIYKCEGGGAAVLGSIQPQPLDFEPDGTLCLKKVKAYIKPDDSHYARTKLLCLENTHMGKVLPLSYLQEAAEFCKTNNLSFHLDGARVFNAAVKCGVDVKEITKHFDTVSFCLSKGLGAPIGSLVCGPKELMHSARRWRKVVGGGMRQAGIIAAAGLYALKNNISRLKEDHANALLLAQGLSEIEGLSVEIAELQTNIFFVSILNGKSHALKEFLHAEGIIIPAGDRVRLVTHLDIDSSDVKRVVAVCKDFFMHHKDTPHQVDTKNVSKGFSY